MRSGSLPLITESPFTTLSSTGGSSKRAPGLSAHRLLRSQRHEICYFPDTKTLYIKLPDRVSSSSEADSDNRIVDFDEMGKPVGVTLEHYSHISNTGTIETLLPISPALQPA